MSHWHKHPGVRSGAQLTLGERAADRMRNSMGSWGFVFAALGFLAVWMGYNGHRGFDPYPFILLNLVLSCVAALQGAILLIAAKRADQVSSELATHDHEILLGQNSDLAALHTATAGLRSRMDELHRAKTNADSEFHLHQAADTDTLKHDLSTAVDLLSSLHSRLDGMARTGIPTPTDTP
jgi:uncharacterized membrane protein